MKIRYKKFLIFIIFLSFCIIGFVFFLIPEQGFHGYVIQDKNLSIYFPDFPSFWSSIKKQQITTSATKYLFEYLYNIELFFRKKWGIRPTPFRWYLWAGKPLLISWNEQGDYLVSIKPGRLFQLFLLPSLKISNTIIDDGEYYYIWKGKELLISNKDTVLNTVVPFSSKPSNTNNNLAYIELGKNVKASLFIHSENNLYIEGKILSEKGTDDCFTLFSDLSNLSLSSALVCSPLIDMLSDISLKNTLLSLIPRNTLHPISIWLYSFKDTYLEKLYLQFIEKGILKKSTFFYSGIPDKFSNPIPVFGFWFPYKSRDIKQLFSELDFDWRYYPHQWNSFEGYIVPIWNNAFCLSLVYYKEGWIICTQEPLMAEITTLLYENKRDLTTNPVLNINFAQFGDDIEKIFLWCAKQELLNGINERDISGLYSPWKQFFKDVGTFTLTIRSVENKEENYYLIRGGFINEK